MLSKRWIAGKTAPFRALLVSERNFPLRDRPKHAGR
jgi:hypothetical protein